MATQFTKKDRAALTQMAFIIYAILIAPKLIQWAYIVLLDDEPFIQLGVLLVAALIVEPIGMWVLIRRRRIAHRFLGAFALVAHMLMTVFIWFIALESFGIQIEEGAPIWAIAVMLFLVVKDIAILGLIEMPEQWKVKPNIKKEMWAEAATFFFSAMVFAVFWAAGIQSIPVDTASAIEVTLTSLVLGLVFIIVYMSSNVTTLLMNETGEFDKRKFIMTFATSALIAAIPFIFELF